MREILPGIFHWTAIHPEIRVEVSSYWLEDGGVLIDPLIPPDEGLEWFGGRQSAVVLSNRLHYRASADFGVPVHVPRSGLHAFTDRGPVIPYDPGDELPGGLRAFKVAGICPDDMALYLGGARALAFADGLVRGSAEASGLGFVPDSLMDDPPGTKRALLDSFSRALDELEFEHVLLAHGWPLIGDGRARLQELVDAGGRTAFEL